jgi:hypothetical protein
VYASAAAQNKCQEIKEQSPNIIILKEVFNLVFERELVAGASNVKLVSIERYAFKKR